MHRDLVCRMPIDSDSAAAKSEYQGKTYYFCSEECKKTFEANPEKYVKMNHDGGGCCG